MAERTSNGNNRLSLPGARGIETATTAARRQMSWLWSRESLLRIALSVVLAVALWLYVTGRQNPADIDFPQPIPVSAAYLDSSHLTITNTLGTVHVRYRTDNPNVYVGLGSFQASVNLLKHGPGTFHLPITVISDPGITVSSVSPSFVYVEVQRRLTKRVPVVADYHGTSPLAGYQAGATQIAPNYVNVTGPDSIVSTVTQAGVDLTLTGVGSKINEQLRPVPETGQGLPVPDPSKVAVDPPEVQVIVPIAAVAGYKTLPILVPVTGHPRAGYGVGGITPNPATVTATGPPAALSRLTALSTQAVNVSGRGAGQFSKRVSLKLPKGVSSSTRFVTITVQLKPVEASSATEIAVIPRNVPPGLVAHVRPALVVVTVIGPSSALRKAAHGLVATVDLANQGVGLYQLPPLVTAPRGITVGGVYPSLISVSVQVSPTG